MTDLARHTYWYNSGINVIEATNHFLIGVKARSVERDSPEPLHLALEFQRDGTQALSDLLTKVSDCYLSCSFEGITESLPSFVLRVPGEPGDLEAENCFGRWFG